MIALDGTLNKGRAWALNAILAVSMAAAYEAKP